MWLLSHQARAAGGAVDFGAVSGRAFEPDDPDLSVVINLLRFLLHDVTRTRYWEAARACADERKGTER